MHLRNAYFIRLCRTALMVLIGGAVHTAAAPAPWYEIYFSQVANDVAKAKTHPQSIDRILAQKIALARSSIDAALHEIDSDRMTQALITAHERGVRVRLVTEHDYMDEISIEDLQEAGVAIVSDGGRSGLMHNKFLIIDKRYVWTGSLNTTDNGAFKNNNNALWIDSPELAENYTQAFLEMFELKQFGGSARFTIPHPVITMADGTTVQTAFAPDHDVVQVLVELIRRAKRSIYFMAFSFTHDDIGAAMKDRFAAGVEVRGVFETRGADTQYSEFPSMKKLGIPVMTDTNKWTMHHKVIIIDGQTVVTGSFNFSKNASRTNDENVLILAGNPAIAQRFTEEFYRVSDATASAAAVASATGKVDINHASQKQLEGLPGIGPALAKRIIAGRPYQSLQDLERVRGLGARKIAAFQGMVVFE